MNNELEIRFGGDKHIKLETLTDFLEKYKELLYQINNDLGLTKSDLIIEVSPPEEGSFKIKLNPKYENLLLNTMSSIVAGTLAGLLILWVSNNDNKFSIEDIQEILSVIDSRNKKEIVAQVHKHYQRIEIKQTINQSFKIISNDKNIKSLGISHKAKEIINIKRSDYDEHIIEDIPLAEEVIETEIIENDIVSIIIKTVHFEGEAKWGFIWKGYSIKASVKDKSFLNKLNSEPFKRGDILEVKLQKRRVLNKDLNTYVVDERSYVILEVLNHKSKSEEINYKLAFKK